MATYATSIPVIHTDEATRTRFLVQVYQHLALAVAAFIGFEFLLFTSGLAERFAEIVFAGGGMGWLLVLGGFAIVSAITSRAAYNLDNPSAQYAGLFGLAAAEGLIFAPFLWYVFNVRDAGGSVLMAAFTTLIGFAALTVVAMVTRRDLSFMRPLLMWGGIAAIGLIVAAVLFGFALGPIFSVAMIALAGASILYQTQTIVRQYPAGAYVGAAVSLFGSLMMMFWYVLRLFVGRD
jgi:FtsH-binding integral membrane protein